MGLSRTVDASGIVTSRISGTIDLKDCLASARELVGMARGNRLYEIVIYDPGCTIGISFTESAKLLGASKELLAPLELSVFAFVAPNSLIFALCRQFQMQLEEKNIKAAVFHDQAAAETWVRTHLAP
jgi:hypothetical protein